MLVNGITNGIGHTFGGLGPQLNCLDVLLIFGNQATVVLLLDLGNLLPDFLKNRFFDLWHGDVRDGNGST